MKKFLYVLLVACSMPANLVAMQQYKHEFSLRKQEKRAIILKYLPKESLVLEPILKQDPLYNPIFNLFLVNLYCEKIEDASYLVKVVAEGNATQQEAQQLFWQCKDRSLEYKHTKYGTLLGSPEVIYGECQEVMEKCGYDAKQIIKQVCLVSKALAEVNNDKEKILEQLQQYKKDNPKKK